ncbi:MAG: hypothetical protein WCJ84_00400 [Candidatus Peregrinibacteria bacterium]
MSFRTNYAAGEQLPAVDLNDAHKMVIGLAVYGKKNILGSGMTFTDDVGFLAAASGTTLLVFNTTGGNRESRSVTTDWASATAMGGICKIGSYVYVLLRDASNNHRVYRYSATNIAGGGTLMTHSFFGNSTTFGMASDGTKLFFNNGAGYRFGDATTQFTITNPTGSTWRYTYTGTGTAPLFVTNGMATGQVLNIAGFTNANNNGTITVSAVAETYFEITNAVGSELVVDGSFPTATNWTFEANWTFDGTNFEADSTGSNFTKVYLTTSPTQSKTSQYNTSFEVKNISIGNVHFIIGTTQGTSRSANGTYTETLTTTGSSIFVGAEGGTAFYGSVDNISAKYAGGFAESNKTGIIVSYPDLVVKQATISGTTLTAGAIITCGTTAGYFDYFAVDTSSIYAKDNTTPYLLRKYNLSGTIQSTSLYGLANEALLNANGLLMITDGTTFYPAL